MVVANVPATSGTDISSQVLALFVEPDTSDGYTEFNASINWGDGGSGSGSVAAIGGGLFEVTGSHTYSTNPTGAIGVTLSQAWTSFNSAVESAGKFVQGQVGRLKTLGEFESLKKYELYLNSLDPPTGEDGSSAKGVPPRAKFAITEEQYQAARNLYLESKKKEDHFFIPELASPQTSKLVPDNEKQQSQSRIAAENAALFLKWKDPNWGMVEIRQMNDKVVPLLGSLMYEPVYQTFKSKERIQWEINNAGRVNDHIQILQADWSKERKGHDPSQMEGFSNWHGPRENLVKVPSAWDHVPIIGALREAAYHLNNGDPAFAAIALGFAYMDAAPLISAAKGIAQKTIAGLGEWIGSSGKSIAGTLGNIGCFVAGTLVWVAAPRMVEATGSSTSVAPTIPIEEVRLGERVPTRNPEVVQGPIACHRDYSGWKEIRLEVRHANGSIVDVQLLRPREWIERNWLRVGETIDLRLTEMELNASAIVVSITDGPVVLPGEGAVITGRFVTRAGSELVRVTFAGGFELVGTKSHPVWSPLECRWRGLGEFKTGELVQSRHGLVAVESVEHMASHPKIYNIEVDEEHAYEVTDIGILVHNNNPLCEELLQLRNAATRRTLSRTELARWVQLEAEALARIAAPARAALTNAEKDALRAAARDIWQAQTGRRAVWDGLDVHHRIPLEWSHLFPNTNPNQLANLLGITPANHTQVTNAWNAWRQGLNGRIPTRAEVLEQVARIDQRFGHLMHSLP